MLYNERETAFADGCRPVDDGSNWVKLTELKRCLNGEKTDESPLLGDAPATGRWPRSAMCLLRPCGAARRCWSRLG